MKKFKYAVGLVLLISLISTGFAFTPKRLVPVDIRAEGMGGSYYTDTESFYTLFTNPAGLAFTGDKTMWPPFISMEIGGPLEALWEVGKDAITKDIDSSTLTNMVTDLIGDSGFNLNTRIGGPFTFGAIRNNFGWGLVNTISVSGEIPSLTKSNIAASFDMDLVFGYAVPLDLGVFGKLSIGFSGRGITQVGMAYTEGITSLIENDFDTDTLPMNVTIGVGFDMGIQYEVLEFINVAVVLQDLYTATWTKTFLGFENFADWEGSSFKYETLQPKLGIGVGLDIPLEKITGKIISHLGVYLDYKDLWPLFEKKDNPIYRNPVLELSVGAELVLFDVLALRLGINEMYPAVGLGIYLGGFRIDFSVYGKELGLEPGYSPQMNMGLAMTIQY